MQDKKRITKGKKVLIAAFPFLAGIFLCYGLLEGITTGPNNLVRRYKIEFGEDEAEIGDFKTEDFRPQVKLKRWGEECYLRVEFPSAQMPRKDKAPILRPDKKIEYDASDLNIHFYKKGREEIIQEDVEGKRHKFIINEDGAMEFELILKARPVSNVFSFPIKTEGLEFYYQGPLTQAEIDKGALRPEEVVGSYAVYHESKKGGKYKAGKAFHIYRPKIIAQNGDWIWGELNIGTDKTISKNEGTLRITIDRNWLDNAVYPVVIDPTFGYDTKGASSISIENVIRGSAFTEGVSGETVDSITVYLGNTDASSAHVAKYAIYNSDSSLRGDTTVVSMPISSVGWYSGTFSSSINLSASTEYILSAWGDNANVVIYYDTGVADQGHSDSETYGSWPNPASFSHDTNKYSIYSNIITTTFNITATLDDTLPAPTATFNITATLDNTLPPPADSFNITATLGEENAVFFGTNF